MDCGCQAGHKYQRFDSSKFKRAILRAKNGTRTRDPDLGKVVLYQLSYFRKIFYICKR
mgnify:CR=1 FL=1